MKYSIRKALKKDLETINKFNEQESVFVYNSLSEQMLCKPDLIWTEAEFDKILKNRNSFIRVIELDKKVIGMLYITKEMDDSYLCGNTKYADIHTFWVDNLVTDKKEEIAILLLQEADKWAKEKHIKEIRSLEFMRANANSQYYKQANYETRNIGLFKNLHP